MVNAQKWNLQQCIDYALEHNINVQQRMLAQQSEERNLKIAKFSMLPNLNAGVGQSFDFGRSTDREGVLTDNSSMSTSFSVSTSMPLFSGLRIYHQIEANKFNLNAAMEDLAKAKADLELNITSAYLSVLFNKELLSVALSQVEFSKEQVERAEKLVDAGKVAQSELYDAKALLAQDELSAVQCENTLKLSLLDLAQLLELDNIVNFDIVHPEIGDATLLHYTTLLNTDSTFAHALTFRPEIKASEHRLNSSKHALKINQSYYYPSLSLQAGYNSGYYNAYTTDLPQDPFWSQMNVNQREYVGLSLNIPIFNRLEVVNRVKISRLNINQYELELENAKKILLREIQQAYYNAIAAQHKYKASQNSVAASEESFHYAEERYAAGRGTNFDFNDAKTRLIKSQSELLQAKYEYLFRCKILDFYNGNPISL
jgi:outer membrane protein